MSDGQYDPEWVEFAQQLLVEKYIDVSLVAILIFEYLITFDQEFVAIWKRKYTFATWIFVGNRYLAIWYGVMLLLADKVTGLLGCTVAVRLLEALSLTLTIIFGLFSALRVYALWEQNIILPILIITLNLVGVGANIYNFSTLVLYSAEPFAIACLSESPILPQVADRLIKSTHISSIIAEFLVLAITWWKTIGIKREAAKLKINVALTSLLIRDGTIYFLTLLALNITQIVLYQYTDVSGYMGSFIDILTPILISRMMLDLRLLNNKEEITTPTTFSAFSGPAFVIPATPPHASEADVGGSVGYAISGSGSGAWTEMVSATAASSGSPQTTAHDKIPRSLGSIEQVPCPTDDVV